ncbi:MAG TPA: anti-sigma factor domain-containing protein [Candidatus Humimicrobiaceae bacterium]
MKASVVEIYKDYCIVLTRDGRFIRQDMTAGAYEIGDEIVTESAGLFAVKEKPQKKPFGIFARLAAGFAAIVILGGGAYLGIKYAGPGFTLNPVKVASQEAQPKTISSPGQEDIGGGNETALQSEQNFAAEAPDSGSGVAGVQSPESSADASKSGQSLPSSTQGSGQSDKTQSSQDNGAAASSTNSEEGVALAPLPVLFEETIKLEKNNIDIPLDYTDLLITYKLGQTNGLDEGAGEFGIFTIKIKNMQKSTFTGNIDIIFIDKNSTTLQTSAFETGNLVFNDDFTQEIQIAANTDSFIMTLYGSFDGN